MALADAALPLPPLRKGRGSRHRPWHHAVVRLGRGFITRCLIALTTRRLLPRREFPWSAADIFVAYELAGWRLRTASSKRFQRWREVDLTAQGRERLAILPSACLAISAEQRLALAFLELLRQEARFELANRGLPARLADEPEQLAELQREALALAVGSPSRAEAQTCFAVIEQRIADSLRTASAPACQPGAAWL
jgi:hypothetical protein